MAAGWHRPPHPSARDGAVRRWSPARPSLPKSPIGEAIGYALNHWDALVRPLEAGFLEIDNGASERALKPVALGRNYAGLGIMRSRARARRSPSVHGLRPTPHNSDYSRSRNSKSFPFGW